MTESALERSFEPQPEPTPAGRRDTVLLLSQSPEWVAIARLARDHGHLVLEARNVFEALTHVREAAPDLVLLPGNPTGFELLDRLRGDERGSGVSAIVLTVRTTSTRSRRRSTAARTTSCRTTPTRSSSARASGLGSSDGRSRAPTCSATRSPAPIPRRASRSCSSWRSSAWGAWSVRHRSPTSRSTSCRCRERARSARARRDRRRGRRHRPGGRPEARRDRFLERAPRAPASGHAGARRGDEVEQARSQALRPRFSVDGAEVRLTPVVGFVDVVPGVDAEAVQSRAWVATMHAAEQLDLHATRWNRRLEPATSPARGNRLLRWLDRHRTFLQVGAQQLACLGVPLLLYWLFARPGWTSPGASPRRRDRARADRASHLDRVHRGVPAGTPRRGRELSPATAIVAFLPDEADTIVETVEAVLAQDYDELQVILA